MSADPVTAITEQPPTQSPGARRRRIPAADRRLLILDAALDAFARAGYHETSLDDVAERAGVSKALIYEHFGSKHELHGALLEAYVSELLEKVLAAVAAEDPGEERLRAGLDAFFAFVEERRDAWRMLFRNSADPEIARWQERLQGEAAVTITARMAADRPAEAELDPDEAEVVVAMLAQQLLGSVQFLANWWDEHRDIPRERVLAIAMDFAWIGLDRLGRGERWG